MDCKDIKEFFMEYMDGILSIDEAQKMDEHLSSCKECRIELEAMKSVWLRLDDLEPEKISGGLKKRIENMIGNYNPGTNASGKENQYTLFGWLESFWPKRPVIQFAVTLALLIIGLFTGLNIGERKQSEKEIVQLKTDMDELRQVVMNSILDQSSVTERIRGLTMTSMLKDTDKEFYSTLLFLLNSDSDVNVRLAAVNALANFTDNEYVRHELVKSIGLQTSPLVQVSLIDLLAARKESSLSSMLIRMINDPDINIYVKERAGKVLKQFI